MDGPARSGVNPVSMRLAWRGVHLGCVSGLPLLPARLWVGNPSLVARRWRGFINLAMPLILIDTTFWADALTYVLPAPIRRINSGSSTPGWQCMFGPSPYIGVLSPEQRPWRRSCHHRSVVGVHPRIGCPCAWGLPLFLGGIHLFGWSIGEWLRRPLQLVVDWGSGWHLLVGAQPCASAANPVDDLAWLAGVPAIALLRSLGELPNRCGVLIQLIQPVRHRRHSSVSACPWCPVVPLLYGPAQLDVLMHLARVCRGKGWSGPWCPVDLYLSGPGNTPRCLLCTCFLDRVMNECT